MSIPLRFSQLYVAMFSWWALTCLIVMTVPRDWQIAALITMLVPSVIFGALLFRRRIAAKCDFCGAYGRVAYGYQERYEESRPRLDCENCGAIFIRGLRACRAETVAC